MKTIIEPFEEVSASADNRDDSVHHKHQEKQDRDGYEKNRKNSAHHYALQSNTKTLSSLE
nr:MAG TPA: hypothetical protein [Caudoviricetes sp.]